MFSCKTLKSRKITKFSGFLFLNIKTSSLYWMQNVLKFTRRRARYGFDAKKNKKQCWPINQLCWTHHTTDYHSWQCSLLLQITLLLRTRISDAVSLNFKVSANIMFSSNVTMMNQESNCWIERKLYKSVVGTFLRFPGTVHDAQTSCLQSVSCTIHVPGVTIIFTIFFRYLLPHSNFIQKKTMLFWRKWSFFHTRTSFPKNCLICEVTATSRLWVNNFQKNRKNVSIFLKNRKKLKAGRSK